MTTPLCYLVQFDTYQGAAKCAYGDIGLGGTVVILLVLYRMTYYFHNLFTSVSLLDRLLQGRIGNKNCKHHKLVLFY